MISFAGWQMPLRYAGETAEHHAVRRAAGLFDLSHMGEIVVSGPRAGAVLDYALTGFLSVLRPGRARYTMICAEDGGVLDDLVVYRQHEDEFLVIANASNTDVVFESVRDRAAGHDARVTDATGDYALVAIQAPGTPARTASRCSAARRTPRMSGTRSPRTALRPAWSRPAWPPAIRSGLRPACRCTATSSART